LKPETSFKTFGSKWSSQSPQFKMLGSPKLVSAIQESKDKKALKEDKSRTIQVNLNTSINEVTDSSQQLNSKNAAQLTLFSPTMQFSSKNLPSFQ
jgi:hypothetical protein